MTHFYTDVFFKNARHYSRRQAVVTRSFARRERKTLSYHELAEAVEHTAGVLASRFGKGARVVLLFPTSAEFLIAFLGCLRAGVVAVPASHARRFVAGRPATQRLLSIVGNCAPACLLFHEVADFGPIIEAHPGLPRIDFEALREMDSAERYDGPTANAPAFIQYSSGSIAVPKGVMISHANLLSNEVEIQSVFHHDDESHFASWLPNHHDMGLVGGMLQPLFLGTTCHLFPAEEFIQRPGRWFEVIEEGRVHTSGAPNFAYAHCVARIPHDRSYDLSSWRIAFNGAEPVHARTLRAFSQRFGPMGLAEDAQFPCYGLAEATLLVSGGHLGREARIKTFSIKKGRNRTKYAEDDRGLPGSVELVSVGPASTEATIVKIIDVKRAEELAPGEVGRIWVRSAGVASAYFNAAERSLETFKNRLPDERGTFLDTGDVGFQIDGALFIVGRQSNKLILRGQNFYAEEIESMVFDRLEPGCTGLVILQHTDDERVIVIVEARRSLRRDEAFSAKVSAQVSRSLTSLYDITPSEVRIVPEMTLPRTTSGKIQRARCLEKA